MPLLTRTYTFTDGEVAYGSQVDAEIANIVNKLNSLDQGNTTWSEVDVTTLTIHDDIDAGGNKVTNLGTATTAGDAIPYPIVAGYLTAGTLTTTQIASDTITGSTANSGGSAGNIDQGTISTPDFRANAVTNTNTSDDPYSVGLAVNTLATSFSITTIGKPVLIIGSVTVTQDSATILSKARSTIAITLAMDGTGLTDSASALYMDSTSNTFNHTATVPVFYLHTPSAAAHTYALYFQTGGGGTASVIGYHLEAVELRA